MKTKTILYIPFLRAFFDLVLLLLILFASKDFLANFYLPIQAPRHEFLFPLILLFFIVFYLLLGFNKINKKAAYLIGVVDSVLSISSVLFRSYLIRGFEFSAFCTILICMFFLIFFLYGYLQSKIEENKKKKYLWFYTLLWCYLIYSYSFYPFTYLVSWYGRSDIQLSSFPKAKEFVRYEYKLNDATTYKAFFGELHGHTYYSIDARVFGASGPEDYFTYARDIAGLDFCSLTEHDTPNGISDNPEQWRYVVKLTEQYYEPGKFVTFNAFEWTSGEGQHELRGHWFKKNKWDFLNDNTVWGHRNIFFKDTNIPNVPFSHTDAKSDTPEEMWENLKKYSALAIPHHPMGGPVPPFKWEHYNDNYEPIVEMYSAHGSSEAAGAPLCLYNAYLNKDGTCNYSIQYALGMNYHFGLIGSTDSHAGWGGNGTTDPEHSKPEKLINWLVKTYNGTPAMGGGLAGVFAEKLTRESIWNALLNKRTFATKVVATLRKKFGGHIPP